MNTEMSDVDESSNSNKNDEDDMNIRDKYEEVSDDDYEILGAVDRDTLLQDATDFTKGFTFAPGQGKLPKSIFCDDDAEYLAFPTIYCGLRRKENKYEKVYYSDVCKYELRSVDKRVAKNVPNIFFKFRKVQLKSLKDKISLVMCKCKLNGQKISVRDVLDDATREKIV